MGCGATCVCTRIYKGFCLWSNANRHEWVGIKVLAGAANKKCAVTAEISICADRGSETAAVAADISIHAGRSFETVAVAAEISIDAGCGFETMAVAAEIRRPHEQVVRAGKGKQLTAHSPQPTADSLQPTALPCSCCGCRITVERVQNYRFKSVQMDPNRSKA